MIEEVLQELGLSDKEIVAYLAMLSLGSATASSIGIRLNINRSTAQYTCQQLTKKGFTRAIQKNNTYYYSPEPPEKILLVLELKKKEIEKKERKVGEIMSELKSMLHPDASMPKVRFYQGVDGLINMFEDVLNEKTTLYGALQLNSETHPAILDYAFNDYTARRVKSGSKAYMLFNDSPITREYKKNDKRMRRKTLLLPDDIFPFSACFHIYANKVAYYSYKYDDLTGVLIENENISQTAFSIFKMAWNFAMQYTKQKNSIELTLNHQNQKKANQ